MNRFIIRCLVAPVAAASTLALAEAPSPCYWSGQYTKCFPTTGIYLSNQRGLYLGTDDETHYVRLQAPAGMASSQVLTFPSTAGSTGQALILDGSLNFVWATPLTTSALTSALEDFVPVKAPAAAASTANISPLSGNPTIDGVSFTFGGIVLLKNQTDNTENGLWQLDGFGTWSRVQYAPAAGFGSNNTIVVVDPGGTVNGGTMWMSLPDSMTGGSTWVPVPTGATNAPLSGSVAVTTNSTGNLTTSATTSTELGYVHGVTSGIQTQLTAKLTNPMTALGDTIYGGSSGASTSLPGNTTTTAKFLTQTGNGSASAAPSWAQVGLTTGVTGTLPIANGGTGQTSANAAFNALSPMTAAGDTLYGGTAGAATTLTKGTSTQVLHSGTTPSWSAVSLTADVTGTLPVGNGGTGATTLASNGVLYGNSTSAVQALAVNSSGTNKFLTQSSSAAPAWATIASGDLPAATSTAAGAAVAPKMYVVGTAYTNGTPSASSSQAGFAVTRGILFPYQTVDGSWHLRFQIASTITSSNITSGSTLFYNIAISGTTTKNVSSYNQYAGSASINSNIVGIGANTDINSSNIAYAGIANFSGTTRGCTGAVTFGDIELDSKPTWAD